MSLTVGLDRRLVADMYLSALYRRAPERSLIEVRFRAEDGMGRFFAPRERLDLIAQRLLVLAMETDVYVGVLPRRRKGGGRDDLVDLATVAWVDCDSPAAATALRRFRPAPGMIVSSGGSSQNRHAYWFLREPASLDAIETLNKRLALTLGADVRCSDPARILRPGGSVNRKHGLARPVRLLSCAPRQLVDITELQRDLLPSPEPSLRSPRMTLADHSGDVLSGISPRVYFEQLTGIAVGRSGKTCCVFHDDRNPSLHVWQEPERGWYCFGCGRGGSIYQLAAWLWLPANLAAAPLRGRDFIQLRGRLESLLGQAIN